MPQVQSRGLNISSEQHSRLINLLATVKSDLSHLIAALGEGTNLAKEFEQAGIQKESIPARFIDPITQGVYKDPVRLQEDTRDGKPLPGKEGQVFDYNTLMSWYKVELAAGKGVKKITHPYTGLFIETPFSTCTATDLLEEAREFIKTQLHQSLSI